MSMVEVSQIEVTQEDRNAAGAMCLGGLIYEVREGQCDGLDIVQAFARHRIAAEQRGIKEGLERAAMIADRHRDARHAASDNAKKRKQQKEARDHQSMAIEAVHIATAIRNAKDIG